MDLAGEVGVDLQNGCVVGPAVSPRLGRSLTVNVTPPGRKACNFLCAYCVYGWTDIPSRDEWPGASHIIEAVDRALMSSGPVDAIVLAGNGEPTLHPAFAAIVDALFCLRARRSPDATLVLFTNGSTLSRLDVVGSLSRFDRRCVKFDAGDATTFGRLNAPSVTLDSVVRSLRAIRNVTLESTFVSDASGLVSNTTPAALDAWYRAVRRIDPLGVEISTPRRTPVGARLLSVPEPALEDIADVVRSMGIPARVFA